MRIATIARLERRPPVPRRCRDHTLARLAATLGEPPQPAADSAAAPMPA